MNFDDITKRQGALIKDYCVSCNKPLARGAAFCEHCGPPILPGEAPESRTTFWQAMIKITLLTLVFAALVAYKAEWDYMAFFEDTIVAPVAKQEQTVPENDEDYQLFHYVNVSFANIREQPNKKSKIIGGAGKGERLVILEKREHWTQVDMGGKKGWVATRLLSASIE